MKTLAPWVFNPLTFNIILVLCFMLIINQLQVKLEGHEHRSVSQKRKEDHRL